jgi:hypothetical protein
MCYRTAVIHCSVVICMFYLPKQQAMIGCHIKLALICKGREEELVSFYLICRIIPMPFILWSICGKWRRMRTGHLMS